MGHLPHRQVGILQLSLRHPNLVGGQSRGPASYPPASPCSRQTRLSMLPSQCALKLGQGPKNVKNKLIARRCGVHVFLVTPKPDALRMQLLDDLDQMCQGPSQPIEFPDDQDIPRSSIASASERPRRSVVLPDIASRKIFHSPPAAARLLGKASVCSAVDTRTYPMNMTIPPPLALQNSSFMSIMKRQVCQNGRL